MIDVRFPLSVHPVKLLNLRQMNYVRFPLSVHLVKPSNLRQMNHVRLHTCLEDLYCCSSHTFPHICAVVLTYLRSHIHAVCSTARYRAAICSAV